MRKMHFRDAFYMSAEIRTIVDTWASHWDKGSHGELRGEESLFDCFDAAQRAQRDEDSRGSMCNLSFGRHRAQLDLIYE